MNLPPDPRLYCILDLYYVSESEAGRVAGGLLKGGADLLQLRAKNSDLATIGRVAVKLIAQCHEAGVPFILNDFPQLAAEVDADGVHIGQEDGSLPDARKIIGKGKIIGRSTHSIDQARAALSEGFDYIGFGPLYPTPTKPGRPAIGLEDIRIMEKEVGFRIPAFCIGGINRSTLQEVLSFGARRLVVVSALLKSPDVAGETAFIKKAITQIP